MSPATQKLAAFKTKHAMKKYVILVDESNRTNKCSSRPQTLFKKTSSKKFESSKGAAMFADLPKAATKDEKESA
jgi:hypothetical protein